MSGKSLGEQHPEAKAFRRYPQPEVSFWHRRPKRVPES